jgi:hypothetical protein
MIIMNDREADKTEAIMGIFSSFDWVQGEADKTEAIMGIFSSFDWV